MYALVTGASSGIGLEIAKLLAAKGYNLFLVARRQDRLIKLQSMIEKKYNNKVVIFKCDLSKEEEILKMYKASLYYPVEIVVNAAGFGKVGTFDAVDIKDEVEMINTNVIALQYISKLYAKHMKKGRILNIASVAAFQPGPAFATYCATKAYVLSYSVALNYELKKKHKKVRVSTLCPGPVNTEFDKVAGTKFSMNYISAKECAEEAVKGLFKGKMIIMPTSSVKWARVASKILPYKIILPAEYRIQTKKLKG